MSCYVRNEIKHFNSPDNKAKQNKKQADKNVSFRYHNTPYN